MDMRKLYDIEFSAWSQNGEDGIIEHLIGGIDRPDRTFVEIGCGDGHENNTSHLAEHGWQGFVVDRHERRIRQYRERAVERGWRVEAIAKRVTPRDVPSPPWACPDVFSLDIDSIDYWVCKTLLQRGFRPKIMCLEYNAALGSDPVTVPRNRPSNSPKLIYYGASVAAWRRLLEPQLYRFVTVDTAGVNAFFVDTKSVREDVLDGIAWRRWLDCNSLRDRFGRATRRRDRIKGMPLVWV